MRASTSFACFRRAAVLILVLFMAAVSYAQITPSDDAYISSALPTTNYGAAKTLNLSSAANTSFIRFDLTAVPAGYTGASIAKATLKLYVTTCTKSGSFNVDLVNGTWAEKTITYSLQPALGTTIAASVPLATTNKLDYVEVDVTPAVVNWLNGTENDGIALVANSPLVATFDSKESTTTSHGPELDIVYAAGSGAGTITGVLTGPGSGLMGGGTSGTLNLSLTNACSANQVLQWSGTAWLCANLAGGGGGTVTAVGLSAPSTDFIVTGSPVTTSGTLGLGWLVAPDFNNTPGAIVKRDSNGNFSAGTINAASGFNLGGNPFTFGSYAKSNAFLGFAGNSTTTGTSNTGTGAAALSHNSTGYDNTASGFQALLSNTTGNSNTASGFQTLFSNTTGNFNTAVGVLALGANTTANNNTAAGFEALAFNTTGASNTALGSTAMENNTSGNLNTAIGFSSLFKNTSGYQNTALGGNALGANTTGLNNTATGLAALQYATTSNFNTAHGYQALVSTTTGSYNTAIGSSALQANITGTNNTAVGYGAGPDSASTNLTNATSIGANAVVSASNALVLGGTGSNAVNVGIGTAKPQYTLDVQGTGNFTSLVNFSPSQTFPGTGTVTSAGMTAPSNDFTVTGSPITKSGTLALNWGTTGPTNLNTANSIVRRDGTGSFSATSINSSGTVGVNTGNPVAMSATTSYQGGIGLSATAPDANFSIAVLGVSGTPPPPNWGIPAGVVGTTSGTGHSSGVFGLAWASSGNTVGVSALSYGDSGIGLEAWGGGSNATAVVLRSNAGLLRGYDKKATQVFDVANDGTLTSSGLIIGASGSSLPLAYASVGFAADKQSGTSNISVVWNSTAKHYELTIAGVTYDRAKYTAIITLSAAGPRFCGNDSANGNLVVQIWDTQGNPVQADFQVVIFQAH